MMEWREVTLISNREAARNIQLLEFQVEHSVRTFSPGSHVSFITYIENKPELRSYTCLPSDTDKGRVSVAVKKHKDSRGGSDYMRSLQPGHRISMTLPENRFELSWHSSEYLLIAGGIGITPIYSMAQALAAKAKKVRLAYAVHTREEAIFADKLLQTSRLDFELFVSNENNPMDIEQEISRTSKDAELYFCGPLRMLDDTRRAWKTAGRETGSFHFEMFGDSGNAPAEEFKAILPAYKKTVHVKQGQTLLSAMMEAGIPMISDCNRGECGLCSVGIVHSTSEIDHRDVFFSSTEKQENKKMCACVSRAVGGTVTIDTGYRK